jgi:cell division protein FtsQ
MDPRIRQRRIAVRRDEGRRRLRVLVGLVGTACLVGAGVAATHSALLDVDRVDIVGADHTGRADILATAGLDHRRYLIDVDSGAAARRLETLAWVDRATVAKSWPGTVRIRIVERNPVAAVVAEGGKTALVDASGRVLEVADQAPGGTLRLDGLPPAPAPGQVLAIEGKAALAIAAALPSDVRSRIASIDASPQGIVLKLTGKGAPTVEFGGDDQLDAKIVALTTMLAKVELGSANTLDVRVPTAPVVTRKG